MIFEEPSSLKWIGKRAFISCRIRDIHIPDSAEELCECFWRESVLPATFGESSSLHQIGVDPFKGHGQLKEIGIPGSVEGLLRNVVDFTGTHAITDDIGN